MIVMKFRWLITCNNDTEDSNPDRRELQVSYDNGNNWVIVPEVYEDWRIK